MTCTLCDSEVFAAKLCARHYQRQRRGKPLDRTERTPAGEATQIAIRCTKVQLQEWERRAKRAGVGVRQWIRETLDGAK